MRNKKNSALAVKFVAQKKKEKWDRITNLEGAFHTFLTPVVSQCEMVGDHVFHGGHDIAHFAKNGGGKVLVRSVVLSAAVHQDFEGTRVMMKVCGLGNQEVVGEKLGEGWDVLGVEEKQDDKKRMVYDEGLRKHLVFHLVKGGRLPARKEVKPMGMDETISFLEALISSGGTQDPTEETIGKFTETYSDQVVSLELLLNTAIQQALNEFSALEVLCVKGYVYTYDPASIFAREIGAPLLNRLMVLALKTFSDQNTFTNMRIFSVNDYADPKIIPLAKLALRKQKFVRVMEKGNLFKGAGGRYEVGKFPEAEGAMLVIHNNSDGFGQNIETEWMSGSLDGAIGCSGSGAASLKRDREDLLDFVF